MAARDDTPPPNSIQAAIRQTKPFRSVAQEATIGLMLTTEAMRWRFHEAFAEADLTLQQYNVLRILRGAGKDGLPTLDIAERMIERTPGITRMIDRLEKKGLAERRRSTEDRRQVLCHLTPEGRKLVNSLDRPVDRLDDEVMGVLSASEQKQFIRLLNKIRLGLD